MQDRLSDLVNDHTTYIIYQNDRNVLAVRESGFHKGLKRWEGDIFLPSELWRTMEIFLGQRKLQAEKSSLREALRKYVVLEIFSLRLYFLQSKRKVQPLFPFLVKAKRKPQISTSFLFAYEIESLVAKPKRSIAFATALVAKSTLAVVAVLFFFFCRPRDTNAHSV